MRWGTCLEAHLPSPSRGLFVPHYVGGELRFPATTHLYKVKAKPLVVTDYHPFKDCLWFPALVPRSHFSWHSSHQDQIWSTLILHFTSEIVHPLQHYSTQFYFSPKILSSIQILPWCSNFITLSFRLKSRWEKHRGINCGSRAAPLLPLSSQFLAISVA